MSLWLKHDVQQKKIQKMSQNFWLSAYLCKTGSKQYAFKHLAHFLQELVNIRPLKYIYLQNQDVTTLYYDYHEWKK